MLLINYTRPALEDQPWISRYSWEAGRIRRQTGRVSMMAAWLSKSPLPMSPPGSRRVLRRRVRWEWGVGPWSCPRASAPGALQRRLCSGSSVAETLQRELCSGNSKLCSGSSVVETLQRELCSGSSAPEALQRKLCTGYSTAEALQRKLRSGSSAAEALQRKLCSGSSAAEGSQ